MHDDIIFQGCEIFSISIYLIYKVINIYN